MDLNTSSGLSQEAEKELKHDPITEGGPSSVMKKQTITFLVSIAILFIIVESVLFIQFFDPIKAVSEIKSRNESVNKAVVPPIEQTADISRDPNNPSGMITRVYEQGGTWYLELDQFKIYYAEADIEEAIEDGICPSIDECQWPNNFAIGNKDNILTTYRIFPDAIIDLSGLEPYRNMWSAELQGFVPLFPINPTLEEFSQLIKSDNPGGLHAGGAFGIVLSKGAVTEIYGMYLP